MSEKNNHTFGYQLAQLNVASFLTSRDDPSVADFVNALDEINALADTSDGFVWRLQDDGGAALDFDPYGDGTVVNMSVWRDVQSLFAYTYKTAHSKIMARRKEWFHMPAESHFVLWWVPAGHVPSLEEAIDRLHILREEGASPLAFHFKQAFDPIGNMINANSDKA